MLPDLIARRPALFCLVLGAVAATGFAPFNLWPLTLIAVALWLGLVHAAPNARAVLARGWLFGWAHLTVANLWIAQAFSYQDAMPHWLGVPAVGMLCLYLAIYPMAAGWIAWRFGRSGAVPDIGYALAAGAAWIVTEWLRATLLTGYPWPPIAAIWLPVIGVARSVAWLGTYALSGLTVAAAGLLLIGAQRRWRAPASAIVIILALALINVDWAPRPAPANRDAPRLRVVQPDLDQEQRPRDDYAEQNLRALLRLSGTPGSAPRLILWPEGALRYLIEDGYPRDYYWRGDPVAVRQRIAAAIGPRDIVLTGGNAVQFKPDGSIGAITNSIFAIDASGRILARYDKAHLVPWGEYLPWRPVLSRIGLARLVPGEFDFAPGPGPRTVDLPGFGPVGMLICYEVIFSGNIIDPAHRPALIFNPSNDSWYAASGPEQHLAQARLRAIEEGVPIVRATPTGISAIVDADGRVAARTQWNQPAALEGPIPPAHAPTLFAQLGNWMALLVALALTLGAVAIRRRAR